MKTKQRIIATSDWHLTDVSPGYRTESYGTDLMEKVAWILNLADANNADVLIAGDVFNVPRESRAFLRKYLQLFGEMRDVRIFTCPGQHDMINHSQDMRDTNYGLLEACQFIVTPEWGYGWGCNSIADNHEVVIHHRCVTPEPNTLIKGSVTFDELQVNAKLVITGDYHKYHEKTVNGVHFINPGTIARHNIDERDYEPIVVMFDLATMASKNIPIPIRPASGVYKLQEWSNDKNAEKLREKNVGISAYLSTILTTEINSIDPLGLINKMLLKAEQSLILETNEILKEAGCIR